MAGLLFGTQLLAALLEILWVVTLSLIIFLSLKFAGIFRVPADEEDAGADVSKHGGSAYVGNMPENAANPESRQVSENKDAPTLSSTSAA